MSGAHSDWRDTFCGRLSELRDLTTAYQDVVANQGPRLAVVLGERGMGKTRLVQEFYRHLATHYDPEHYWPDAALFNGNKMRVGPDPQDETVKLHFAQFSLGQRRMPFLWWGFRLADPEDRNAIGADLASHRRSLEPHLTPLFFAREASRIAHDERSLGVEVGKSVLLKIIEIVPFVGAVVSLIVEFIEKAFKFRTLRRRRKEIAKERAAAQVTDLQRRRADDLIDATLQDLSAVLTSDGKVSSVPVIVFVDDAQFACLGGDEGALKLLRELWARARASAWPLLIVATHWDSHWFRATDSDHQSFSSVFSETAVAYRSTWRPIQLLRDSDLEGLIAAALPGIDSAERALIAGKADGNPQLLIEIVEQIRRAPAWRTQSGALTPLAKTEIDGTIYDLHRLLIDRLQSDATPSAVRKAVALSSVQGVEFVCALTEAAAESLNVGPVRAGLQQAESPHRYIGGTETGLAAFMQRAYRDAAGAILEQEIGPRPVAEAALLGAAEAIAADEEWRTTRRAEYLAALGTCAALSEYSPLVTARIRGARALLELVANALSLTDGRDYARAGQLALRFERGLTEGRWSAVDFDLAGLDCAFQALLTWYGPNAAAGLARAILERNQAFGTDTVLGETPWAKHSLALAYQRLGSVAAGRSQFLEADQWYNAALRILETLAQGGGTIEVRSSLSSIYQLLSDVAIARSDLDLAERWCKKALAVAQEIESERNSADAKNDLLRIYTGLGDICDQRGRLDDAGSYFEKGIALVELLAHTTRDRDGRSDAAALYERLGDVARARGQLDVAENWFEKARLVGEALANELGTPASRRILLVTYERLGGIAETRGQLDSAQLWFEKALAIDEILSNALGTPQARRDLTVSYGRLGQLAQTRGDGDNAEHWFRKALGVREALLQELGTPDARRDFADTCASLGQLAQTRSDLDAAQDWYAKALAVREPLVHQLGTNIVRQELAESYHQSGDIARLQGHLELAWQLYEGARIAQETLVDELATPFARYALAATHARLGELATMKGEFDEAARWIEKEHAALEILQRDNDTPVGRLRLSMSWIRRAHLFIGREKLDDAWQAIVEALAIRRELYQEGRGPYQREFWEALALAVPLALVLERPEGAALQAELRTVAPEASGPDGGTPILRMRRAGTLLADVMTEASNGAEDEATRLLEEARGIFADVEMKCDPQLAAATEFQIGILDSIFAAEREGRDASLRILDALRRRIRSRLGDRYPVLLTSFDAQIDATLEQIEVADEE